MIGSERPTCNFGSTGPCWSEIADFQPIFARCSSAITPSKKVQLTLIASPLYALSNEPKMIIVRCPLVPQMGLKNAKRPIFVQNRTSLEESHKVSKI